MKTHRNTKLSQKRFLLLRSKSINYKYKWNMNNESSNVNHTGRSILLFPKYNLIQHLQKQCFWLHQVANSKL